jgi:FecR protein
MPKNCNRPYLTLAVWAFIVTQVAPSFAAEGIGSAATVSNRVEGIVGNDALVLRTGSEVYRNELLRTGAASTAHVIFLDDTNLSVGPSSEVKLDRFVYDPDRSQGAVVVRASRGIFRFVTGSQRPQNYLIVTPIATIGVRGTIFDLLVQPNRIIVILISGQIQIATLFNRRVSLVRPGTSLTVYADGRVVGPLVWRGRIRVDFNGTLFPYFPPVRNAGKRSAPPSRVRGIPRGRIHVYRPKAKRHHTDMRRRRHPQRSESYRPKAKYHGRRTKKRSDRTGRQRNYRPGRRNNR